MKNFSEIFPWVGGVIFIIFEVFANKACPNKNLDFWKILYFTICFISFVPFHRQKSFCIWNKQNGQTFISNTKTFLSVKRDKRYEANSKVYYFSKIRVFIWTRFMTRPPQSAVSGRLSARHICENPDLAGTFWTNSR